MQTANHAHFRHQHDFAIDFSSAERRTRIVVTDLHVWQIGLGKFAAIVSVVTHEPRHSNVFRERLREHDELVHVTIETQHCQERHEVLTDS